MIGIDIHLSPKKNPAYWDDIIEVNSKISTVIKKNTTQS